MYIKIRKCVFLYLLLCAPWFVEPLYAQQETSADQKAAGALYREGERFFSEGYFDLCIETLEKYLSDYPQSDRQPEAYFLIAQSNLRLNRDESAVESFLKVVDEYPTAPFAGEARRQLGRAYLQLGLLKEAIAVLEQQAILSEEAEDRQSLYSQVAGLYLIDKQPLKSIELLLKQYEPASEEARLVILDKIRRVVELHMDDWQLKRLTEKYAQSFPGDEALFRLARVAVEDLNLFYADRYLRQFLKTFGAHVYRDQVRELLAQVRRHQENFKYQIGVLLPMTGEQSPYADSVLKGLELAMDQARGSFEEDFVGLVIRDYEGDKRELEKSFLDLAERYRPIAIVGPLLSRDVEAVAPLARARRIPLISPTATARNIAQDNPYIFRNAVPRRFEGKTLAEYAMQSSGLSRFAIFYQDNPFGLEMLKILSEEIGRLGGEIIAAESYPVDAHDFGKEIRHLVEVDLSRYGTLMPPIDPDSEEKPEYFPGFDAVFLQGDSVRLASLAAQLAFYDVKDRTLLVTNGGDSSKFLSAGDRFTEGAIMVQGFFEESTDPIVIDFVKLYQDKYGEHPDIFAAQAYDSLQMILLSLKGGAVNRAQVRDFLAQVRGFHGASGLTSLHPAGGVQKRLFVIQVKDGKLIQVN